MAQTRLVAIIFSFAILATLFSGCINDAPVSIQGPRGLPGSSYYASTWYDHNETSSDVAGYYIFNRTYPTSMEAAKSISLTSASGNVLIASFVSYPGEPGLTLLPAGERIWHIYASVNSVSGGNSYITTRLYKRSTLGVETELYNLTTTSLPVTVSDIVTTVVTAENIAIDPTDRFVVKYYARTESPAEKTVTLYFSGNVHVSKVTSPIVPSSSITGGLPGTKTYYASDTSGGSPTRKLTFVNGILVGET